MAPALEKNQMQEGIKIVHYSRMFYPQVSSATTHRKPIIAGVHRIPGTLIVPTVYTGCILI